MLTERCAYCGKQAAHIDHVVPRSERKKFNFRRIGKRGMIPDEFMGLEPACISCNLNKGQRRLVPPSWAHLVDAMNEFFGGNRWRTWNGDLESLRSVYR